LGLKTDQILLLALQTFDSPVIKSRCLFVCMKVSRHVQPGRVGEFDNWTAKVRRLWWIRS